MYPPPLPLATATVAHHTPPCKHNITGNHIGEAKEYAAANYGDLKYVNGYDDVEICAGAGSMGIEILGKWSGRVRAAGMMW
jgi:threonine dehydratase